MKKPTKPDESDESEEKRGRSQDFLKLQQQYHDGTIDERNRLWPNFIRVIRETYPGFVEELEHKFRTGDYLMAMFGQCMKRVLARPDLNAARKTNAQEDAAVFFAVLDELNQADPRSRELAVELAIRALFTGLRAGLSPREIEELQRDARSETGRPGGKASTKTRHEKAETWKKWVTDQAPSMRGKHPTFAQEDLADKLIALALTKKVDVPDRSAVVKHLSALERTGQLSERTRSRGERTRSRTKPLP